MARLINLTRRHEGTKRLLDDTLERLVTTVIDRAFHLHCDLGPGLLESAYEMILFEDLKRADLDVARQIAVPIEYREIIIENAFKVDWLVEGALVLELKSLERLLPVHGKQLLTYLRLMNLPLGLLMNFGETRFKDGIKRVANGYSGPYGPR